VSEAKVAANVVIADLGWDTGGDSKEKSALDKLCDELLEKGVLVPLSKKKRIFPNDSFLPPDSSLALWTPLLNNLRSHHPTLPYVLAHRIIGFLLSESTSSEIQSNEPNRSDASFDMCLARWAFWIIDSWEVDDDDDNIDFKRDVTATIFTALGPGSIDSTRDQKAALALLQALCAGNEELEEARNILCSSHRAQLHSHWDRNDVTEMDKRLTALLSLDPDENAMEVENPAPQPPRCIKPVSISEIAPGWRLLDHNTTSWRPCPIGVYVPGSDKS
jgi:ribosomal biogenesis protein LAS1